MNPARKKPSAARASAPDPWMSLPQAAAALGCTRMTVLSRALDGELEASRVAGRTVISRASVQRFAARHAVPAT